MVEGKNPGPAGTCENPIAKNAELAHKLRVSGTPTMFLTDGNRLGGYVALAELDKAINEAAASQKTIDGLEADLERLHKQKDQLSRDGFDLAKQVELAKVAKRTAESEIQRTVDLVARKSQESYLTRMPPPPPPPPKS